MLVPSPRPADLHNGRATDFALTHLTAIERARDLAPILRARVEETEALRRIPDQTIAELRQSGLFGLATPRAWGGSELPPETWIEAIAELAAGCGSTAWVYGVLLGHMWLVSQFAHAAQQEVFGEPDALVASLVRLGGSAPQRVAGGFRWRAAAGRFCSGVDHAAWVVVGGTVPASDQVAAEARWFLIPRGDFEIQDDWFAVGLRGTGSKSIHVGDAFIPEHRSILQADLSAGRAPGRQFNPGPLYRLPGSTWAFPLSATCVGIAREAVRVVKDELLRRFAGLSEHALAEQSATLATFAEASSDIDVAYALLQARARHVMDSAARPYTPLDRAEHRRDIVYVVNRARGAVNRLMELSGGSGVYDVTAIQRLWRDCHASAAHASFGWEVGLTAYGRALLDLPPSTSDRFAR